MTHACLPQIECVSFPITSEIVCTLDWNMVSTYNCIAMGMLIGEQELYIMKQN